MTALLMELFTVLAAGIILWKIQPVKPFISDSINEDYLSRDTGNSLRGFFAVVVVLHHLSQRTQLGYTFRAFSLVGTLAVSVFFFLSGYGIQKSNIDSKAYKMVFLQKRIPAVLFPYILIAFLYWLVSYTTATPVSLWEAICSLFGTDSIVSHSWYIIDILLIYVFFWIEMLVFSRHYNLTVIFTAVCNCILMFLCIKHYANSWTFISTPLFTVGVVWASYEKSIVSFLRKHYFLVLAACFAVFSVLFCFTTKIVAILGCEWMSIPLKSVSLIAFVMCVLLGVMKFRIGNKLLSFLGRISLEIYITQGLFQKLFHSDVIRLNNDFIFCIANILCTIALAYPLHKLFSWLLSHWNKLILPKKAK